MKTILSASILFASLFFTSCSQGTEKTAGKEAGEKTACICKNCGESCDKSCGAACCKDK
jgi:PBP1b-binding outer membrane lipoprotein LpoB